jgi:hypothetical protein
MFLLESVCLCLNQLDLSVYKGTCEIRIAGYSAFRVFLGVKT